MVDPVLAAIDRAFDFVDGVVAKADHVLNVADRVLRGGVPTPAPKSRRRGQTRRERPAATAGAAALVTTKKAAPQFRIVEATEADTGVAVFIVTNGLQKAECATRELAVKFLAMLEAAAV